MWGALTVSSARRCQQLCRAVPRWPAPTRAAAAAAAGAAAAAAAALGGAAAAAAPATALDEDDPDGDNLHVWLQQRGASVSGVQFRRCADAAKGRGAFLTPSADSSNRGLLLMLPRNLVLTAERAMDAVPELRTLRAQAVGSDGALAAALADERSGPPLLLTLFVLHSRLSAGAEDGEWADYIAALPFDFDTPVLWPRDSAAVECLAGTPLEAAVVAKHSWLAHLQQALPSALREAGACGRKTAAVPLLNTPTKVSHIESDHFA